MTIYEFESAKKNVLIKAHELEQIIRLRGVDGYLLIPFDCLFNTDNLNENDEIMIIQDIPISDYIIKDITNMDLCVQEDCLLAGSGESLTIKIQKNPDQYIEIYRDFSAYEIPKYYRFNIKDNDFMESDLQIYELTNCLEHIKRDGINTMGKPKIEVQPNYIICKVGNKARLYIEASGLKVKYQWQLSENKKKWKNLIDAKSNEIVFDIWNYDPKKQYIRCKVYNDYGYVYSDVIDIIEIPRKTKIEPIIDMLRQSISERI